MSQDNHFATILNRVQRARHNRFVGRANELALFRRALDPNVDDFNILLVHGPGGIGKTSLLREFSRIADERGRQVVLLDGRLVEPSPAGVLLALQLALRLESPAQVLPALASMENLALIVDTTEMLSPVEEWLREELVTALHANAIVVLAGRGRPDDAWSSDSGWAEVTRVLALRNLSVEECTLYLGARGVTSEEHLAVADVTHGHPLALSLVADLISESGSAHNDLGMEWARLAQDPDIVQLLLRRFAGAIEEESRRRALEICAHMHTTTEGLLAAVLGEPAARDAFTWLQGLSFVETGPHGIYPHDLARDVIEADLIWRDPQRFRTMHRAVRQPILAQIPHTTGMEQQNLIHAMHFLHRNQPLMRPFFAWQHFGKLYAEVANPADFPAIEAMVLRHQGAIAAAQTHHWFASQPQGFVVFRGADAQIGGFLHVIEMAHVTDADAGADSTVAGVRVWLSSEHPDAQGNVYYYRNWMARDEHQRSPTMHNMAAMVLLRPIFSDPSIALSMVVSAEPELYRPVFEHIRFEEVEALAFTLDDHTYSVFAHDWVAEPMPVWIEIMGEREIGAQTPNGAAGDPSASAQLVALSEEEFGMAVLQALRDWTRPDRLAHNPLLRSRMMSDRCGSAPTAIDLATLLREVANTLAAHPRDRKLLRALEATYFMPVATQEAAAEALDLPFSTYRSHLVKGVARVRARLWQMDLRGK